MNERVVSAFNATKTVIFKSKFGIAVGRDTGFEDAELRHNIVKNHEELAQSLPQQDMELIQK